MKPLQVCLIVLALAAFGGLAYVANQAINKEPEKRAQLTITERKPAEGWLEISVFKDLFDPSHAKFSKALKQIDDNWRPGYGTMLFETSRMLSDAFRADEILSFMQKKTRQNIDPDNFFAWSQYLLNNLAEMPPYYVEFKAFAHTQKFKELGEYFENYPVTEIGLDEVTWGGVNRNGIPPLKDPKVLAAKDALYLDDTNIVFGIEVNGEARAYPKRILAWHEMVKDTVGNESVNGVYCTLCGSMILYSTIVDGQHYELGTSGFLYRSNKLMFDEATLSLWSTLEGRPVIGELVGKGIRLSPLQVVTTTWGDWRKLHPDTTVLSLDTGHSRIYDEGEAYREYFATDRLMFPVMDTDDRLKNKDEVLAIRFDELTQEKLVISADFLSENRVYHDELAKRKFVVVTDESGANRVYECKDWKFKEITSEDKVIDEQGGEWTYDEVSLTGPNGEKLERLPAHRAYWFGWRAAFPDTRLVK